MLNKSAVLFAAFAIGCAGSDVSPVTEPRDIRETDGQQTRALDLRIFGRGATTEWTIRTLAGETHSVSSTIAGATRDLPVGMPRDTIFQYMFDGPPTVGTQILPAAAVEVMYFDGMPQLVRRTGTADNFVAGTPSLMLFVWPPNNAAPTREIVQSDVASVTFEEYVAPANGAQGRVTGRIDFVGDEWIRERTLDGTTTLRPTSVKVRVRTRFTVPWEARSQSVDTRPAVQ